MVIESSLAGPDRLNSYPAKRFVQPHAPRRASATALYGTTHGPGTSGEAAMTNMIVDELGRIPMSPFLTATLTRAADYATAQAHREVTLEHLVARSR